MDEWIQCRVRTDFETKRKPPQRCAAGEDMSSDHADEGKFLELFCTFPLALIGVDYFGFGCRQGPLFVVLGNDCFLTGGGFDFL